MSEDRPPADLGRSVTGTALQLFIEAISPSLMPGERLGDDHMLPTLFLASLFGPDEDWVLRGQEVGGAVLRKLNLRGSMNSERALRVVLDWFARNHPDAPAIGMENADYKGADIMLYVDYPPEFLLGLLRRVTWDTRGKAVDARPEDPYRFHATF